MQERGKEPGEGLLWENSPSGSAPTDLVRRPSAASGVRAAALRLEEKVSVKHGQKRAHCADPHKPTLSAPCFILGAATALPDRSLSKQGRTFSRSFLLLTPPSHRSFTLPYRNRPIPLAPWASAWVHLHSGLWQKPPYHLPGIRTWHLLHV